MPTGLAKPTRLAPGDPADVVRRAAEYRALVIYAWLRAIRSPFGWPSAPRGRHGSERLGFQKPALTMEEHMQQTHSGECFCGAVEIRVTGKPNAMGYCHCSSCRSWSAGPVNAFTLWPTESVEVVRGAEHLDTFAKTALSHRKFCR